jgi:hypothetical protein
MIGKLRLIALSLVALTTTLSWAQAPQSGTYKIRSAKGTYVQIKGKYYAKPDATADNASEVGIGVGYKDEGGYRVYSLTGTNPNDGSLIEVYDYVDKACKIVSEFAQYELDKKLGTGSDKGANQIALDAMADSICQIYTDDYAYMTIIPIAHYGDKWLVRAKATVPAIPYTIQAIGNAIVVGNVVNEGHECTDVWDWAKEHVKKYLNEHQTDQTLKNMALKYLDDVVPGTTYYLNYEDKDNSFGYELTPSDNGIWTLETVSASDDGIASGVYNIQNKETQMYVDVTGKYSAEPELESISTEQDKKNAAIYVEFGRYLRDTKNGASVANSKNTYRITELSNQGRDVVAYLYKGMQKANSIVDQKLAAKNEEGNSVYSVAATLINSKIDEKAEATGQTINHITADQIQADVKTAFDLCAEHYAYMNLIDNGDKTVSLRVDVPAVPAALDIITPYLDSNYEKFIDFAKAQIDGYFESSNTDDNLKKLWKQNRDKWTAGTSYYLSADDFPSFAFTTDASEAATKWLLTDVDESGDTNPFNGYFRAKNVGGYNGQEGYVVVKGRITADASATDEDKATKPGSILYVKLASAPTKISSPYNADETVDAYELLNVRSQGLDVMNGCETPIEEIPTLLGLDSDASNVQSAYNGYAGFARYMVSVFSQVATSMIADNSSDQTAFKELMNDFTTNYLPNLKFQVYLIPIEGKTDTYLVRSMVPSMKPISDFYNANQEGCDAYILPAASTFLERWSSVMDKIGFTGEKITEEDDELINSWYSSDGGSFHVKDLCTKNDDGTYKWSYSSILSNDFYIFNYLKLQLYHAAKLYNKLDVFNDYLNMVHYNTPYYLIQGDNHDSNGNRKYTPGPGLGFANDGTNAIVNDLNNAGEHAYWALEAITNDADNYFTVKPIANQARNGKYYASAYLDFPFEVKGENVSAVYKVSSSKVESGTAKDSEGNDVDVQYVQLEKVTDGVIPAAQPVFIEYNQSTVDNTLALLPVVNDSRYTKKDADLVQGTFLGGKHKGNHQTGETSELFGSAIQDLKNFYQGSLQDKWGVNTDGKDLYLFGYNTKDELNPYGFYLYSAANDDSTIPANKPFLIQTPSASPAKIFIMFDDGEATGIESIETTEKADANAPRYNIAGQRVDSNYKGIVVINGKKYIQK